MASDRQSDEILLNALADGELGPAEQAAAAARLRTDRDFARAFATLSRLKAAVAENGETAGRAAGELPLIAVAPPAWRRGWIAYGLAASLALLFGVTILFVLRPMPHENARTAALPVLPATFVGDPVIPDLSYAGLQLSRTVVTVSTGVQSLVATYLGPRGCKLELWVRNAPAPAVERTGTERRRWEVGALRYELIAFGMPAARFAKVAALAERETRATRPLDEGEPLIQARIPRPPCVA